MQLCLNNLRPRPFLGDPTLRGRTRSFLFLRVALFFLLAGACVDLALDVPLFWAGLVPFRFAIFFFFLRVAFFFLLAGALADFSSGLSDELLPAGVTLITTLLPVSTAVPTKAPASLDISLMIFEGSNSVFCRVAMFQSL